MTIKHIVLCGGGPVGLVSYGAIKKLMNNNIIIYENIKSIYSTSIGCFIAFIFMLNLKLDWIDDYIIKRPWENLVNFSTIIEAIAMSSSIPIMIKPPFYNGEYYLDGGLCCNCPLYDCYYNQQCSKNEIIVFTNEKSSSSDLYYNYFNNIKNDTSYNNLNENTNIFSFLIYIIKTIFKKIMIIENNNPITIKNTINVSITPYCFDINLWSYIYSNKEERIKLIDFGEQLGNDFINTFENNDISFNLTNNDISFNLNNNNILLTLINNDISFNLTNNDISFENIIIKKLPE